jgi:hypothetical protein
MRVLQGDNFRTTVDGMLFGMIRLFAPGLGHTSKQVHLTGQIAKKISALCSNHLLKLRHFSSLHNFIVLFRSQYIVDIFTAEIGEFH